MASDDSVSLEYYRKQLPYGVKKKRSSVLEPQGEPIHEQEISEKIKLYRPFARDRFGNSLLQPSKNDKYLIVLIN